MTSEEVQARLSRIEEIATLPHVATEILSILRNQNASMRQIADVIEKDPSITAKILKVSNSPIWGFSGRIDNLQRALVLLGLKQVSNIVIAVSMYTTFNKLKPNPEFDREKFWLHSIGTSQIARSLAQQLGLNFHGEEFVASLIHDIGKIVLDQYFTDIFVQVLHESHAQKTPSLELEKRYLGITHAQIGALLLEHWKFPQSIIRAVHYHHNPIAVDTNKDLVATIRLADVMCELWGIGFDEDIQSVDLYSDSGWRTLKYFAPRLAQLDIERFLFEVDREIEKAKMFIELVN